MSVNPARDSVSPCCSPVILSPFCQQHTHHTHTHTQIHYSVRYSIRIKIPIRIGQFKYMRSALMFSILRMLLFFGLKMAPDRVTAVTVHHQLFYFLRKPICGLKKCLLQYPVRTLFNDWTVYINYNVLYSVYTLRCTCTLYNVCTCTFKNMRLCKLNSF